MKKLLILFICLTISLMPLLCINELSYAESIGGGGGGAWDNISNEEQLVAAFKAYCRSRNFNISHEPNYVKSIVKFDYDQIQKSAAIANVDLTSLNAHIWYMYDNSGFLKFYFDYSGLTALSGIYAAIINENNITENSQKTLYTGKWFSDMDNDGAFIYDISTTSVGFDEGSSSTFDSYINKKGSAYKNRNMLVNLVNDGYSSITMNLKTNFTYTVNLYRRNDNLYSFTNNNNANSSFYANGYNDGYYSDNKGSGDLIIATINNGNSIYLTRISYGTHKRYTRTYYYGSISTITEIVDGDVDNADIEANQGENTTEPSNKGLVVNTNDNSINNYITNNNITNNTYNYTDDDDNPPSPPSYTNPYDNNPTGGTIGNDGSINFQMPDLNIDWNLGLNVENLPFPFSIPFDFNNALKMLDVEPETPRFQGTITIPYINYDWEIDLDFGKYDEYETLINMFQKVFLFGYVISLIIATRSIMHIY